MRVERYTEGKENILGNEITETVYDKDGNFLRSYSYNSLAPSDKTYTESETDESGNRKRKKEQFPAPLFSARADAGRALTFVRFVRIVRGVGGDVLPFGRGSAVRGGDVRRALFACATLCLGGILP